MNPFPGSWYSVKTVVCFLLVINSPNLYQFGEIVFRKNTNPRNEFISRKLVFRENSCVFSPCHKSSKWIHFPERVKPVKGAVSIGFAQKQESPWLFPARASRIKSGTDLLSHLLRQYHRLWRA